ncbi:hypothetical protein EJB05_34294 [Eragrostis curvula]|uniref:Uncharacterized protein n=1 Tax=Eragrostis curvula TaxID=38414 RepID=A0A5J9U4W7_9POAL|nr:hypothetical protein EJB05_34294 [Eragrostis curvula]
MYQIPKHVEPPSSKGALHKGFKDLMKKPEEPEGINPFFQDAPSFPFRMQSNPKRMAIWFKWLINEIRAGMTKQSASENKGIAKFILEMAMEDPETREQIGYCYKLVVTPESGYFKVVLIPHRELVDELGDAAKPIELAFDFANLYSLSQYLVSL